MLNRWIRRAFHPHRYYLAAFAKYAAFAMMGIVLVISETLGGLLFFPLLLVGVISHLATIPALARDRWYIKSMDVGWVPSRTYYVMFFLPVILGPIAAVLYLYKRHDHLGLLDTK